MWGGEKCGAERNVGQREMWGREKYGAERNVGRREMWGGDMRLNGKNGHSDQAHHRVSMGTKNWKDNTTMGNRDKTQSKSITDRSSEVIHH